jgi:hypothetical protein
MDHIVLDHDRLRVVIDEKTGAIREIVHKPAGISLIAQPDVAARHPFMVVFADGATDHSWRDCTIEQQREGVCVRWSLERGLSLAVHLRLDAASGELQCTPVLENPRGIGVAAVAYPFIAGIGRLGANPDQDELVHPYATGFLVRNPLDRLPASATETEGQQPILLGLYPEGFSGSTMQFMAYQAVGRGGFYVAAQDSVGTEKWLNFYRHAEGDLRLAVWHGPADYGAHRSVAPEYVTVLAAIDGGAWYDAAEQYKAWALNQPWAAQGPLWARDDRCRWLLEDVGLSTFGINPRYNRAPWLAEIDRIAGTPVLHVLGPNWSRMPSDYMNTHPGGLADWFPASFAPENQAVLRQNGDRVVPFEFDLLFGRGEECTERAAGSEALQVLPRPTLSRDAYDFPFLCPATPFARDLHVGRDRTLVEEYGVDGVYYDISVNNVRHICLSPSHGHAIGDTVALTDGYRQLLSTTAAAMRDAAGGVAIPQGTEMINEQMLPLVAFYQARAEASPVAPFEAGPFRELIKADHAEKIPLFAYVYHEYGPVRLDGWAKLSREQGELVYFVLGRVFLQGGLIELNYEFSALEDLGEYRDTVAEHYYAFDDRHYTIDPGLAAFVGRLSRNRIGRANRYLAYGTMQRPAALTVEEDPMVELDYFLYNCGTTMQEDEDRGTLRVPAVLQVAWCYRDESAAWMVLNVASDERTIELPLDPPALGRAQPSAVTLTVHEDGKPAQPLGLLTERRTVRLTLPPRAPVMLEALPIASEGR